MAWSEIEAFLGVPTSAVCGFASARRGLTLLCGTFIASTGQSQGVRVSELCACTQRLG